MKSLYFLIEIPIWELYFMFIPMNKILLVDSDGPFRRQMAGLVEQIGYVVEEADSYEEAVSKMRHYSPNIVVTAESLSDSKGTDIASYVKNCIEAPVYCLYGGRNTEFRDFFDSTFPKSKPYKCLKALEDGIRDLSE